MVLKGPRCDATLRALPTKGTHTRVSWARICSGVQPGQLLGLVSEVEVNSLNTSLKE